MEFVRRDKYSSVSAEGYTVSAASVNGQWVFTAWPPKDAPTQGALKYSQCVNDCYTACRDHYHQQQPKAA